MRAEEVEVDSEDEGGEDEQAATRVTRGTARDREDSEEEEVKKRRMQREAKRTGGESASRAETKRAKVQRDAKRRGEDEGAAGEEERQKKMKLGKIREVEGMRGGKVQVAGREDNLRKVADKWGMEVVKESGDGDLCVGGVDWSTLSEFGRINGSWKKEAFEEAERVVEEMRNAEERNAIVVCCGPVKSAMWKLKTMKDLEKRERRWGV